MSAIKQTKTQDTRDQLFLAMLKHGEPIDLTLAAQLCGFIGLHGQDYFETCKWVADEVLGGLEKQGLVKSYQEKYRTVWEVVEGAE